MTIGETQASRWKVAALVLAGLAVAALLALGALAAWSGAAGIEKTEFIPLAADKSLGVNADLSKLDAAQREAALKAMEEAGFGWLRQRFSWRAIEPRRGAFDWQVWDAIVAGAERHGLQLIAVLDGTPAWARRDEDAANPFAPPARNRDFGDFAQAVAGRYAGRIAAYQIWDEPNIAPHWGAREIDPAAYDRLLREGAIRVRAADPGAVVLAAALAPNVEPGGANMSELLFLEALYQAGGAEWFDVLAVQPYDFGQPLESAADAARLNWARVALLRAVMERYGDRGTAVWAVSFGSRGPEPEAVPSVVTRARLEWPWLGPMLWAAWSPQDSHGEYALLNDDGVPGAAYGALQDLAAAPVIAWPGSYPADHSSGRYEGQWRVTPSGADIGASGDRLEIPFRGTRLDLTVRRGDYRAFLFVTVDGALANALPRDSEGRAYVVLYDPELGTESVTLAAGLPDREHLAEIVAERGWGQWAIVGWSVGREVDGGAPWLPAALALGALGVLAATVVVAWPQRRALQATLAESVGRYRALDERLTLTITALAAVLVYAANGTGPTLVALGILGGLLLLRPATGLPLIALALPFYQPGVALLGKVFSLVEILVLLTAVGWGVNRLLSGRLQWPQLTTLDWGVVALVAVAVLSLLWAEHLREAARELRTVVLESAIYYGLLRAMLRGRRGVWLVVDAWVLGGAAVALLGIAQWALGQNLITAEGVWRVRGFYGSPNNLALYLGRLLPLVVAVSVFGPWRAEGSQPSSRRRRWLYGLATLLMAGALFLTYSRGAWLLGVPASLLFIAALRGRRALLATAGLLLVTAVGGLAAVGGERITSLLDITAGTTFFRLQLWQSSWAMIRDHPLLGVGLDNFLYAYRSHYVLPTAWEEFNLSHPHNLALDFWLRLGVAGLVVISWLLIGFFRRGWQEYRRLPEGEMRLLVLGLMGGMVNFVAHGLVDNAFFLVDLAFVFMLMLVLVQATRS